MRTNLLLRQRCEHCDDEDENGLQKDYIVVGWKI